MGIHTKLSEPKAHFPHLVRVSFTHVFRTTNDGARRHSPCHLLTRYKYAIGYRADIEKLWS